MKYRVLFILFVFGSCSTEKDQPEVGSITNANYHNEFFDLSIDLPQGWIGRTFEEQRKLSDSLGAVSNQDLSGVITHLALVLEKQDTSLKFNPTFVFISEKLQVDKLNERSYLLLTERQLKETGQYQIYDNSKNTVAIDGVDFYSLRVSRKQSDALIEQEFFVRIQKGYAILFILSYSGSEQRTRLQEIVDNISL